MIAHEVGHHVQDLTGPLDEAHNLQARASETEGNAIQVKVELQADCYAGVWAANAKDAQGQPVMEQGDFEEGMRAAEAIGDDTLQTPERRAGSSPTASPTAPRRSAWKRSSAATRAAIPNACKF